ncbi:MAG: thioredoxin family protein [Erysipelotrichaceae bacterium]
MKKYKLIELSLDGCANCISMKANLIELSKTFPDLEVAFLDASLNIDLVKQYNIESLPCLILICDDKLIASVNGFQPLEILEIWIESKISVS